MADDFAKQVDDGLRLSKRLYFGKDRAVSAPKPILHMEKSHNYLPTSPMVYAVIPDPSIVDNPDIPSYQPHVYGRCDPPALIPLQMNGVQLHVDCFLDTAIVCVSGSWRVHCVMGSKACDCKIAVPMGGDQGSILGVEVQVSRKTYSTQFVEVQDKKDIDKTACVEDGGFLKPHIFTIKIPQVDGGSNLSIKISWSQKLQYRNGQFSLNVPFNFPEYVTPAGRKMSKKEKIQVNVNAGVGSEVLCETTSHPLKELRRQAGKLGFLYEAEVLSWSCSNLNFSYRVISSHMFGTVLLQSPSIDDFDQREMFCIYLLPGNQQNVKVLKKDVVFVIDISGSVKGKLLDNVKNGLIASLHKLDPEDSFGIIAFNSDIYQNSTSMQLATKEAIEKAIQWIDTNFIPDGGTNILNPLNKAVEMLSDSNGSIPMIFLVTDGSVEDERHICDTMKSRLTNGGLISPCIHTFGIGTFCNHYFLRMLALIGKGHYDAAYDVDTTKVRMQALLSRATSTVLSNIAVDSLEDLEVEMYPSRITDLSSECPLAVFGRYEGAFPDCLKLRGTSAAASNSHVVELKVQQAKDIPLHQIFGKQQIDQLTAQSWFSDDKQLKEKAAKLSTQLHIASEFTRMLLMETVEEMNNKEVADSKKASHSGASKRTTDDGKGQKTVMLRNLCVGFGDLTSTSENIVPGSEQTKLPEAAEILVKAASSCCGSMCNRCCCMCCIQCCSRLNDQFVIVLTQLCSALACFGCVECCSLCCSGHDV